MKKTLLCLTITTLIVGCAGTNPADPYESYNRKVYAFNTTVDKAVLKPIAQGYKAVTPNIVRSGVSNASQNLTEPRNMVNNILQLKPVAFLEATHRFVFNSTFGLGGLIDLTNTFRLPEYKNSNFGSTLAYYGWKDSNYFLVPFLAPGTVRDQVGLAVDVFATDPKNYAFNTREELIYDGVVIVNDRANILDAESISQKVALDQYVFQREAVMQYRENQLRQIGIQATDHSARFDDDDEDGFSIADIARQNADE